MNKHLLLLSLGAFILLNSSANAQSPTCDIAQIKQLGEKMMAETAEPKIEIPLPETGCSYRNKIFGEDYFTKKLEMERNPERNHIYLFFLEQMNGKKPEVGASFSADGKTLLRFLENK